MKLKTLNLILIIGFLTIFCGNTAYGATFPGALNEFVEADLIDDRDWNALEYTIGITGSASTTSLTWKLDTLIGTTSLPLLIDIGTITNFEAGNSTTTNATTTSLAIIGQTGSTQCAQFDSNGLLTGTGSSCTGGLWDAGDSLTIFPQDQNDVVIIGANATTTIGNIFEVVGSSLFDNFVGLKATTTSATTTDFYVSGDLTIANDLALTNLTLATGNVYMGDGSNNPIATSTVFIDTNSFVGIGTTSPSIAKLEVGGDIFASGMISADFKKGNGGHVLSDRLVDVAIVNEAGGVTRGQALYIVDASGDKSRVALADKALHDSSHVWALAAEDGANGETVLVQISGHLEDVDTSSYTVGCRLHLANNGDLECGYSDPGGHGGIGMPTKINANTGIIEIQFVPAIHSLHGYPDLDADIGVGSDDDTAFISFENWSGSSLGWINGAGDFVWGSPTTTAASASNFWINSSGGLTVANSTTTNATTTRLSLDTRDINDYMDFYNGSFTESFNATTTSDGSIITMHLENALGTGNLTMRLNAGDVSLTAPTSTPLTAGSDTSPTENFVYIPYDTQALTVSTSDWPASTEHIKVGFFLVPSASFVQSNGVYVNQNWNDHAADNNDQGHMTHMAERSRRLGAEYHSGIDGNGDGATYVLRTDATPDTVYIKSTSGVIYQMHKHTVSAYDTSGADTFLIPNSSVNAYESGSDLYNFLVDADGDSMSGKYYNLVLWGVANKTGEFDPLMVNLPTCSYNFQSSAEQDTDGCDVFDLPASFNRESSTGFLIARLTMRHQGGGQDLTLISTVDLRGSTPQSATGGTAAGSLVNFPDNQFTIFDETDSTKIGAFDIGTLVTTGNTRTVKWPDLDGTMPLLETLNTWTAGNIFTNATTTGSLYVEKDLFVYDAINNGNPTINIGSSNTDDFEIKTVYNSGAQTLDYISFETTESTGGADKGEFRFLVDNVLTTTIDDGGIEVSDIVATNSTTTNATSTDMYISGDLTIANDLALTNLTLATGNIYMGDGSNNPIATSTIYIDVNGKVGIATTSPQDDFSIAQTDTDAFFSMYADGATMRFGSSGGANYFQSGCARSSGSSCDIFFTDFFGANTWMTIASSTGNVGIGVTDPGELFTVSGGNARFEETKGSEMFQIRPGDASQETTWPAIRVDGGGTTNFDNPKASTFSFNTGGSAGSRDLIFEEGTTDRLTIHGGNDVADGDIAFGDGTDFYFDLTNGGLLLNKATTTSATTTNMAITGDLYYEQSLFSFTLSSTSPEFVSGGTLDVAKNTLFARELTRFRCHVDGGTSIVVNVSDDGTNDTETITCATTQTSDDDVATNDTFTAEELWRIEIGTIVGTPDYLIFESYGYITK